jgi:ABC-type phosphate transport system ATPase subunit
METLLQVQGLNLVLNNESILKELSCEIPKSLITVLIGRSGAGKSTLLKSIVRFFNYTGKITYQNANILDRQINELRREIAYVGQVPTVFPGKVRSNILFGRKYWNMTADDNVAKKYIAMVDLDPSILDKSADKLSVGQKQRVHLARTLALEPKVLLLDEPASNLDVISKNKFETMIFKLKEDNPDLTVVVITHDLMQARRVGDHLILLDQGRVLLEENSDDFFKNTLINGHEEDDGELLEQLLLRLNKEAN